MSEAQLTTKWPQYLASAAACGGALAMGTALGWPSPVASRLLADQELGFEITDVQFDWISAILTAGCAISCIPIGWLMNSFGRKWTMLGLVAPFLVGWMLLIWARNFVMLLLGRLFIGIAGGAFCISAPHYSAEIAEKEIRGIVGTFFQLFLNVGILYVYVVGPFVSVTWTNVACAAVAVAFGLVFVFMPESPVFLVAKGREDDARASYKWLRGVAYDPSREIQALKDELEERARTRMPFVEVMRLRASKMAVVVGFGLVTFFQMSGINVVIFYSTRIFDEANVAMEPSTSTIVVGAVNVAFTVVGSLLVDRLGRRLLLLTSIVGMTLSTLALGVFFFLLDRGEDVSGVGWLPLTSLSLFFVTFSIGYGPVVWLMISEVSSPQLSAFVAPLAGVYNWTFAFAITLTFRPISEAIGNGATFWIFTGVSFVGILFTFFVVPETKGRSMADIQRMLAGETVESAEK